MKKETTVRYTLDNLPEDTETDWARVDALTDEEIEAAIADDPDAAPILDEEFWKNARLVMPEDREKVPVSIRLDREIVRFFERGGRGYQSRINAVLLAYVRSREEHADRPPHKGVS